MSSSDTNENIEKIRVKNVKLFRAIMGRRSKIPGQLAKSHEHHLKARASSRDPPGSAFCARFPFPTSITSKVNTHAGALAGGSSLPPSWALEALEHEAELRTRSWPLDSPEVYMKFVPAVRKRGGRKENEMLQWRRETEQKAGGVCTTAACPESPYQRCPTIWCHSMAPLSTTVLGHRHSYPGIHAAHWHHRIRHALE